MTLTLLTAQNIHAVAAGLIPVAGAASRGPNPSQPRNPAEPQSRLMDFK